MAVSIHHQDHFQAYSFHLGEITALTMTPDSEYIIAGSQDGTINVFRTITNQLYKSIGRVHEGIEKSIGIYL